MFWPSEGPFELFELLHKLASWGDKMVQVLEGVLGESSFHKVKKSTVNGCTSTFCSCVKSVSGHNNRSIEYVTCLVQQLSSIG